LASSDEVGTVYIWNLDSRQAIRTISGGLGSGTKGKITNLLFWLGDPESLKGGKKPLIMFPDVPKLIESNEDDRLEREHVITVWNRFEQNGVHGNSNGTSSMLSNGSMAEINSLKVQLAKCQGINQRLHEFCVENVIGEGPISKKMKHN